MNRFEGHTKGPWHVESQLNVFGVGGIPICSAGSTGTNSVKHYNKNVANIKLIAAAPKLLRQRDSAITHLTSLLEVLSSSNLPGLYEIRESETARRARVFISECEKGKSK